MCVREGRREGGSMQDCTGGAQVPTESSPVFLDGSSSQFHERRKTELGTAPHKSAGMEGISKQVQ